MAKVATVLTELFEDSEYTSPVAALQDAGHEITTIGFNKGETVNGKQGETSVTIDEGIADARPEDYDALLIPGGFSPDQLRADERFLTFTKHFAEHNKPIFSICHGPQLLVNVDVLKGKKVTSVSQVAVDVKNAGAQYLDEEVVVDDSGLISSRTPDDLPAFNREIVKALAS
jgi:protease I